MFKKILTFITDTVYPFLTKLFSTFTFKDWLLVILTVLAVVFFWKYRYYEERSRTLSQNYNETLADYINKIGQQYVRQQLHVIEIDKLKEENSSLYAEVKNLMENPLVVTKTVTKFRVDTIPAESVKIEEDPADSTYILHWQHNEPDIFGITGRTSVKNDFSSFSTTIDNLSVQQELTLDVIDDGKQLGVIAKSDNPYVTVTGMQSVFIDPRTSPTVKQYFKPKRWGIGVHAGYGVDKNLHGTWYLGAGISYNIIAF